MTDDICLKTKYPLCQQICENTKESYVCKCHPGYKLDDNMVTCTQLVAENVNNSKLSSYISNNVTKGEESLQTFENKIDLDADEDTDLDPDDEIENDLEETAVKETVCPTGFKVDLLRPQQCLDINECLLNLHDCKSNQICQNTNGAFRCIGSCSPGFEFNKDTLKCQGKQFSVRIKKKRCVQFLIFGEIYWCNKCLSYNFFNKH